jgi:hypothetical protein
MPRILLSPVCRTTCALLLLTMGVGCGKSEAPDTTEYTLTARKPVVGQVVHVDAVEKASRQMRLGPKSKSQDMTTRTIYTDTIEEVVGQKPTRLRREYEKAEKEEDGGRTFLPYHGQLILIEKQGEKFRFLLDKGQELTGDIKSLKREFDQDAVFSLESVLPKQAVKVKDSWTVDPASMTKAMGAVDELFDHNRGKATATLLSVEKRDNRQFGKIELQVELAPLTLGKQKVRDGAYVKGTVTVEGCLDGSLELWTVEAHLNVFAEAQTQNGLITLEGKTHAVEKHEERPQK